MIKVPIRVISLYMQIHRYASLLITVFILVATTPALSKQKRRSKQESNKPKTTLRSYFLEGDKIPKSNFTLSGFAGVYGFIGYHMGAKTSVLLVRDGFIGAVNDSISAELGLFYYTWLYFKQVKYSGSMRWDFHLLPAWTVYAAPGLVAEKYTNLQYNDEYDFQLSITLGAFWNVARHFALRGEVDVRDQSLRAGATLRL
jgi:hypothetical protein